MDGLKSSETLLNGIPAKLMIKCCKGPIIDHHRQFNKIKKTILHFVHSKITEVTSKFSELEIGIFQSFLCASVFQGLLLLNFMVRSHVFEKRSKFCLVLSFLSSLYWDTGRLDPQGEIVPKEFPNPEQPRIWGGGEEGVKTNWHGPANSYICSFY